MLVDPGSRCMPLYLGLPGLKHPTERKSVTHWRIEVEVRPLSQLKPVGR